MFPVAPSGFPTLPGFGNATNPGNQGNLDNPANFND